MRAALLGLLAVASLAAAADIQVLPAGLDALRAERMELPGRLEVPRVETEQAVADAPPLGTEAEPAEMAPVPTPAGTRVTAGHWTYAATVRERTPDAAPSGRFVVELLRDGESLGQVHLRQSIPDPVARESARVVFDLGPDNPAGALLVLRVTPAAASAEARLTSALSPTTADYAWRGDDGTENPTLSATAGQEHRIRIVNGDGTAAHDVRVRGPDGRSVAGPSGDVENRGDERVLAWTPAGPGAHRYECRYHPGMSGTIQVTP